MKKCIEVTINGLKTKVEQGASILAAARSVNVHIPTLCYSERYTATGSCRVCAVEVNGNVAKPVPACATRVAPHDSIVTDSETLRRFRRADLALLLSRHPNACMQCEVRQKYAKLSHNQDLASVGL